MIKYINTIWDFSLGYGTHLPSCSFVVCLGVFSPCALPALLQRLTHLLLLVHCSGKLKSPKVFCPLCFYFFTNCLSHSSQAPSPLSAFSVGDSVYTILLTNTFYHSYHSTLSFNNLASFILLVLLQFQNILLYIRVMESRSLLTFPLLFLGNRFALKLLLQNSHKI